MEVLALYEAMQMQAAPAAAAAGAPDRPARSPAGQPQTRWISPQEKARFARGMAGAGSSPEGVAWFMSED